jgi:hypothetical protein
VRTAIAAAALAAAALVASCGSDDPPEPLRLQSLVLQDSDLPDPFEPFARGPALRPEGGAGRRGDRRRFGRRGGWSVSFRRPGAAATAGPLVVVSRVDEFGDAEGAERALAEVGAELRRVGRPLAAPRIGADTVAVVQTRGGTAPARFYTIAWRDDRLTASLRVSGFARGLDEDDALALARTQAARMRRALEPSSANGNGGH